MDRITDNGLHPPNLFRGADRLARAPRSHGTIATLSLIVPSPLCWTSTYLPFTLVLSPSAVSDHLDSPVCDGGGPLDVKQTCKLQRLTFMVGKVPR